MTKKSWLVILGAIFLLLGIGTIAVLAGKKDSSKQGAKMSTSGEHGGHGHLGKKEACDYLTQASANTLLGDGAQNGSLNADSSSGDVHVSTCTYTSKADSLEAVQQMKTASMLLRAPLTEAGAESNEVPFGSRPDGAQDVDGYGDDAYWDPGMGQLNVLKDGAWLIISNGKSRPGDRTLAEAKQLADIVVPAYNKH
jgi:hypothetical protein